MMKVRGVAVAFVLLLHLIGCADEDSAEITQISAPCATTEGTITPVVVPTDLIDRMVNLNVYTPPCYENTSCDYPILFLLNGGGGSHNSWAYNGTMQTVDELIASAELPPLLIIMPHSYDFAEQFERVFLGATLPYIDDLYRVKTEREQRAVAGASVGGGLALNMGLKHPEQFGSIGILSYGSVGDLLDFLAVRLDALSDPPAMDLRIGSEDGFLQNHIDLHEQLEQRDIEHVYLIDEGGVHTGPSIQASVPDMLRWIGEQVGGEGC